MLSGIDSLNRNVDQLKPKYLLAEEAKKSSRTKPYDRYGNATTFIINADHLLLETRCGRWRPPTGPRKKIIRGDEPNDSTWV